jgi:peptidoglycan glycosyltransferase
VNRSIRRLYLAIVVGFGLLAAFLCWWQVVAAEGLENRRDNPYVVERERRTDRGPIISADGQFLARSVARRVRGQKQFRRVYPKGALAPHVVGYATPELGQTGIESSYNRYLAGSYGTQPLLQRLNLEEKQGATVQLTLDTRVQQVAVDALAGRAGGVVALDPRTGAVIAMASAPTFNLNDVGTRFAAIRRQSGSPLLARPTQSRQPPGSTFKVVTATAALQSGGYTPTSRFVDTGRFVVNGRAITNFGGQVYGPHTLETALTKSINTTFAKIGQELGADRLGATMTAFGFGADPDVPDLPDSMLIPSGRFNGGELLPNDERGIDTARVAIGQERLAATPLQMAMVAAGIANDGTLMRPYFVERVRDRGGETVREARPEKAGNVTPPDVASAVSAMMQSVVKEGTGTAAALAGLQVAGKTGTAESGVAGRNQAWFIGFAPADDPVVAVAVLIEDTSGTGGREAAPVAGQVMRAAIEVGR